MGNIVVRNLRKEFVERRSIDRDSTDRYVPYGETSLVLDDIDLEFFQGEMACILGPSGCGKSTMLRIIAGFEKSTSGTVMIDGRSTSPSPNQAFVFQHCSLFPWLTVRQNVELGIRGENKKLKTEKSGEYIRMADLEGFEDSYPHELSKGMKRRAELARALVVDPDILFLDEPFTGLDFVTHLKMRDEVVKMHRKIGKTILVVTHDIDDALFMGNRIIVLSRRPSQVKMICNLKCPHPRNLQQNDELIGIRDSVLSMLGVEDSSLES